MKKGDESMLVRERDHIPITSIMVYCCNCSIINLCMCLINELNFVRGCLWMGKKTVCVGQYCPWFQESMGDLETPLVEKGKLLYFMCYCKNVPFKTYYNISEAGEVHTFGTS